MKLQEKASYILGLIEGSKLDVTKEENNIIKNIAELSREISESVEDMARMCEKMNSMIDELDEDLSNIEEDYYKDKNSKLCNSMKEPNSCHCKSLVNHEEEEDYDEEGGYEVECPHCKNKIELNDDIFDKEDILCPICKEKIDFDFTKDIDEN